MYINPYPLYCYVANIRLGYEWLAVRNTLAFFVVKRFIEPVLGVIHFTNPCPALKDKQPWGIFTTLHFLTNLQMGPIS